LRKLFSKTNIIAAFIFLLYYVATTQFLGLSAPTMILMGFPCPGCGMTRAARFFITGNFAQSFAMHPLLMPTAAFALWAFVWWLKGKDMEKLKTPFIILLVIFLITYIARMWLFFPHQEPLVANPDSLLHNMINLFKRRLQS